MTEKQKQIEIEAMSYAVRMADKQPEFNSLSLEQKEMYLLIKVDEYKRNRKYMKFILLAAIVVIVWFVI